MRTSYTARQGRDGEQQRGQNRRRDLPARKRQPGDARQHHERNDDTDLQLFVCAHDIGQAGLQLGYRRVLGYLDRTPMSHLVRVSFLY